jgi:hypothetical protein
VVPAQVGAAGFDGAAKQYRLQVRLLKIDEGGAAVPGLGQQVEGIDERIAGEDLAHAPVHAAGGDLLAAAEPVENFQRALGMADGARARTRRMLPVQQHHRYAALSQIDRQRQPDRPRPHHDHRMMGRSRRIPIRHFDRRRHPGRGSGTHCRPPAP